LAKVAAVALLAGLAWMAGCSGSGDPELSERVDRLAVEQAGLLDRVDDLEAKLQELVELAHTLNDQLGTPESPTPFAVRLSELGGQVRRLEKMLAQVETDLQARISEMVRQGSGARRVLLPAEPPPPPMRFETRPTMAFDGDNIQPDVAKLLKLETTVGVIVTDVTEGKAADEAGLKKNDIVQRFDDTEVKNCEDLKRALAAKKPGETVTLGVLRGKEQLELRVTLAARKVRVDGGVADRP
jgi:hypothetical protein